MNKTPKFSSMVFLSPLLSFFISQTPIDVWRYDIKSNSWTQDKYNIPSPLITRSYASGLVVAGMHL